MRKNKIIKKLILCLIITIILLCTSCNDHSNIEIKQLQDQFNSINQKCKDRIIFKQFDIVRRKNISEELLVSGCYCEKAPEITDSEYNFYLKLVNDKKYSEPFCRIVSTEYRSTPIDQEYLEKIK